MGINSLVGSKEDDSQPETKGTDQKSKNEEMDTDELTQKVKLKRFLHQYDPRDFTYRGPDPPTIFETATLDEHWHEEWVDKTGEWSPSKGIPALPEKDFVGTECECGNKLQMPAMARYTRCSVCNRVLINKEWEDSRVENPNLKGSDITDFL